MSTTPDLNAELGNWKHVFSARAEQYRQEAAALRAEVPIIGASPELIARMSWEGAVRADRADKLADAYARKADAAAQGFVLVTRTEQSERGHRPDQQNLIVMANAAGRLKTED